MRTSTEPMALIACVYWMPAFAGMTMGEWDVAHRHLQSLWLTRRPAPGWLAPRNSEEERNNDRKNKAAVPRRRGRQHSAHRAAEGGAREAREGRDHRRAAQGGRGPRDREDHQEAGGDRPQGRDRRRVPPLVVAFRFLRHARRRRNLRARPRHPVPGRADQAAEHPHPRQARLFQSSDAGAFQVSQGAHARHAEDDHPEPGHAAFPPRAERGRHQGIQADRDAIFDDLGEHLPAGHQGLLRCRLPLSAIRRHRVGLSVLAGRAEKGAGARH